MPDNSDISKKPISRVDIIWGALAAAATTVAVKDFTERYLTAPEQSPDSATIAPLSANSRNTRGRFDLYAEMQAQKEKGDNATALNTKDFSIYQDIKAKYEDASTSETATARSEFMKSLKSEKDNSQVIGRLIYHGAGLPDDEKSGKLLLAILENVPQARTIKFKIDEKGTSLDLVALLEKGTPAYSASGTATYEVPTWKDMPIMADIKQASKSGVQR